MRQDLQFSPVFVKLRDIVPHAHDEVIRYRQLKVATFEVAN